MLMTGAIVSRPGAIEQRFHADADNWHFFWSTLLPRHRIYNIFIPLCDIDADSCGTQFWPGSHLGLTRKQKYRTAMERSGCIENDPAAMRAMDAPACPAGGLIVADFRTLHRGLPNRGEANPRPIAYAIVGTGGAKDDIQLSRIVAAPESGGHRDGGRRRRGSVGGDAGGGERRVSRVRRDRPDL